MVSYQDHHPSDTNPNMLNTVNATDQKKVDNESKQTYTIIRPTFIAQVYGLHKSQRHVSATWAAARRRIRRGDERH